MSEKMQYVKSGLFSYSGKVITILSSLVYTFLVANYLGPEKYGLVSYYISFTLGLMGTFGVYYFAGLVGVFMSRWKSRRFLKYNLFGVSVISISLFLGLYVFSEGIVNYLGKSNYDLLRVTSFLLLVIPYTLFYTWIFRSFKFFGKELKFNLIVGLINLVCAFVLVVILDYGAFGVVYALILSNIVGFAFLFLCSRRLKYLNKSIVFSEIKRYSIYGIPATFLNRIDNQILMVFMGLFIIDNDLGMYYIALKIVSNVLSIPVASLTEVILPYLSESSNDRRKVARYFSYNIKLSLIITSILSFIILVFSKPLLLFLFPGYIGSYPLMLMLIVLFLFYSLDPLNSLFMSLNRMDVIVRSKFCGLIGTLIFGLLLMPYFGVYGLIMAQILNALVTRGILVYSLKSLGLEVEIIPRRRDFVYFLDSLNKLILTVFSRIRW